MLSEKQIEIIEELFLIKDIVKYIVPEKPSKKKEKLSRLEEKLDNTPKRKREEDNLDLFKEILFQLENQEDRKKFSANIKKNNKKTEDKRRNNNYSFIVDYQETESNETINVVAKEGDNSYSLELKRIKPTKEPIPYSINITYDSKKDQLELKYKTDYSEKREEKLQDFTNQVDKTLHIMPESLMGGVLGFTYLGENFMARRADLTGSKARMVDVHEAIHTPDEYETRILTDWMLTRVKPKYFR